MAFTPLNLGSNTPKAFTPLTSDQLSTALSVGTQAHATKLQQLQQQQAEMQAKAQYLQSPAGLVAETTKGTAGTIANTALRFVQSAVKAPFDIVNTLRGKGPDTQALPTFSDDKQQTFQGEFASKTMPNVMAGKISPLAATAQTTGGVVGGALDTLGLIESGKLAKTGIEKVAGMYKGAGGAVEDVLALSRDRKATQAAVKALTPRMTTAEMEAAPNVVRPKIGAPRVDLTSDKGFMKLVEDTKGIVKGKSAIDDKNALQGAISKTAENLKTFFSQNKVATNFANLIKKLDLVKPESSLAADPSAFKTYSRVKEEVQASIYDAMKGAAKSSGDFGSMTNPNDFWEAMKILDTKAQSELGTKVFGSPEYTGVKAAIQDMRQSLVQYASDSLRFPGQMEKVNAVQDFVQTAREKGIPIDTPKQAMALMRQAGITNTTEDAARAAFAQDAMSKMSNYYKAIDMVQTKIPSEIRGGATWAKRNPIKAGAASYAAKATATGLVGYGVGKETGIIP